MRSKCWDEFAEEGAPSLAFIFTVCDNAAGEACPIWPGRPITAHWGIGDPAAFEGSEDDQRLLFHRTYVELERRIELFVNLDLESLDSTSLRAHLDGIGRLSGSGKGAVAPGNDRHGNSEALPRNQMNDESPRVSAA